MALGRHYVEGRIDDAELDRRLMIVFAASDAEQAGGALAGLPALGASMPVRRSRGRHGEAANAQPTWTPTSERFVDPSTTRVMRVWVDPRDGVRHYVVENGG